MPKFEYITPITITTTNTFMLKSIFFKTKKIEELLFKFKTINTLKTNRNNTFLNSSLLVILFLFSNSILGQDYSNTKVKDKDLYSKVKSFDTINYFNKAKENILRGEYRQALKNSYKISREDLYANEFEIDRIKAIAHSTLHRPDSALVFAYKTLYYPEQDKFGELMIEPYGVLAYNHYKYWEVDSAYKYMNLSLKVLRAIPLEGKEAVRIMRKYRMAGIVALKTSNDRGDKLKIISVIVVVISFFIVAFVVYYYFKKRIQFKRKLKAFKGELKKLNKENNFKKEQIKPNAINNETTKRVLEDLYNMEKTTMYLDKDFSLSVLAKLLKTNTSYLSRIINEHKQKSFKQYLIDLRISALIKNLDENPIMHKYSIEALGNSIGYTNASSFTRVFKSHVGVSPSEYLRKKYSK